MKYFAILLIMSLSLTLTCCSGAKNADEEAGKLTGKIFMTGNEPFTHLALMVDENTTWILNGNAEVIKMLRSHQGEIAEVTFSGRADVPGGKALIVTDAVLKKTETKK